jgi:hypothetical protein
LQFALRTILGAPAPRPVAVAVLLVYFLHAICLTLTPLFLLACVAVLCAARMQGRRHGGDGGREHQRPGVRGCQ